MDLIRADTGKPETLDEVQALEGLAKGTHTPSDGQLLINRDGELVVSPLGIVKSAVAKGSYRYPNQGDLDEFHKQKAYGEGTLNEFKAGAEGFLRGSTFGISDLLEPMILPTTKEAIRERKERSPGAADLGEVGGAVASAVLAPELSPAGLLGKVGTGIAERLAPKILGEGANIATKVLNAAGHVAAKSAGSSVEGAVYGLAQTASEDFLGDANLNSEKLMGNLVDNVLYGATVGGVLGGLWKAGEIAIPATIGGAKKAIKGARDLLIGAPGEKAGPLGQAFAKVAGAVSGEAPDDIIKALETRAEGVILDPAQKSKLVTNLKDSVQSVHDAVDKIGGEAGGKVRPQETEILLKDADLSKAIDAANDMDIKLNQTIQAMKDEPDLYPKSFRRKLELFQEGFQKRVTDPEVTAAKNFESLNTLKRQVDEIIPYDKIRDRVPLSLEEKEVIGVIKPLVDSIRSGLEDEAIWGVAGARQAAFNAASTELKAATTRMRKLFWNRTLGAFDEKKFNTYVNEIKTGSGKMKSDAIQRFFDASNAMVAEAEKTAESAPFPGFKGNMARGLIDKSKGLTEQAQNAIMTQPGQGYGFFTSLFQGHMLGGPGIGKALIDPYAAVNRLTNMERLIQKTDQKISSLSKEAVTKTKSEKPMAALSWINPKDQRLDYDKDTDKIQKFNTDPEGTLTKLDLVTRDLYHVAPNHSTSMQMGAIRAAQFLGTKIPHSTTPKLPLDKPFQPTLPQMIQFQKYNRVVKNPFLALEDLSHDVMSKETTETLTAVYPGLYNQMKVEVMGHVASGLAENIFIPYQKRLALSVFLQEPLDSSLLPQNIQSNQAVLAAQNSKKQAENSAPTAPNSEGIGKITLANNIKTNNQKAAQRGSA